MVNRPVAAGMGVIADLLAGEPPVDPHPVALFGRAMRRIERAIYRDSRMVGIGHAAAGVALGAAAAALVPSTVVATYVAAAGRGLADAALDVGRALDEGDLDRARTLLPALVGRDPSDLDEREIRRAVVESVAENTVDAVVAPLFWGAVAGARGVAVHRAINTLDAMVGYRSERYERYGWASARLDDVAAYVPARVTALLVAAVRPRAAASVIRRVARDAPAHPSPNAGVAEAAFAAALGLRLGGANVYGERVEMRTTLGDGRPPEGSDIGRAVLLSRDVALAGVAVAVVAGMIR